MDVAIQIKKALDKEVREMGEAIRYIPNWNSFSELRIIQQNISGLGYKKEYIKKHKLEKTKKPHWSNMINGVINFYEPIEVKQEDNEVFWRCSENHIHMDIPETFETQFGVFNNHNNGELISWLGKSDYDGPMTEDERIVNSIYGRNDYFLEGNYCDMFDCGEYTYAISNLMHMGLGKFKIVRIDEEFNTLIMFDNYTFEDFTRLEYAGGFRSKSEYIIIAVGAREIENNTDGRKFQKITLLFSIDEMGNCTIKNEWNISISSANSMVAVGDYVYFGQNKMVTRLNVLSGEIEYFTNKSDEELSALAYV